jgi:MerR HTH family regulatory protein
MTEATLWTLDELVQLARHALAVDYDGAPSARVRDLPDRRLVRWYGTRGLVDRPAATNGRNALYTRRHLLQLVAIKRRQAQGHSLAQIQAELSGATDEALERIAQLTMELPAPTAHGPTAAAPRPRFWMERPAAASPSAASPSPVRPEPPGNHQTPPLVPSSWPLRAIELSPGITLLVDANRCADVSPDTVRAAARPLLNLLVPATTDERSTP